MYQKWYLQTWFICLLIALWILIVPAIVGVILLIFQIIEQSKVVKKYGKAVDIDNALLQRSAELDEMAKFKSTELENTISSKSAELDELISEKQAQIRALDMKYISNDEVINGKISVLKQDLKELQSEISSYEKDALISQYNFSNYDGLTSEECKNKLSTLRIKEKELISNEPWVKVSSYDSKKELNNNKKQLLRCLTSECDNVFLNLKVSNIDTSRNKIAKSFESLNKVFETDGLTIQQPLLDLKLEELNLIYTYEVKRQQEIETQKAIKEQMVEEEKVRREIEREKAKIEKDQQQCTNEISKLIQYMQKTTNDVEKKLYIDKVTELEAKLKSLESDKETVLEREVNARAGYVYIISNIGSFGENIYKIGMTRRLEPMDRVKELSSASVPFEFDVHAMIFSTDAPTLETTLHQHFEKQSVNKINLRKEFFKVSIDEIEKVVKSNFNNTVEFTKFAIAKEYRDSLQLA